MWSKQADTRNKSGSNMTSFKNKITNRKSKNAGDKAAVEPSTEAANEQDKKKQQPTKSPNPKPGRNRARNKNKKETAKNPDKVNETVIVPADNNTKPKSISKETELIDNNTDECDGVVLRNPNSARTSNTSVKRYSDSFVIENQIGSAEEIAEEEKITVPTPLTRALSGFFVTDQSKKQNRRFSDLFRPASSKLSGSTESLKMPIKLEKNAPEKSSKVAVKEAKEKSKSSKKTDRVIQKSLGHFHFGRLTRQTTNLERISRPFGSQKSVENAQSNGLERPALAKSKSSSAINLSLLRARRAKVMDNGSAALCKDEFDFIPFCESRLTGSSTSLHKFPSWLHINKGESKVSQPVSRTGSDRRPDAVREEGARPAEDSNSHQQADGSLNHTETSVEKKDSASSQAGAKRRAGGHINRSESVKEQSEKVPDFLFVSFEYTQRALKLQIRKQQRRNISDPSHSTNTSGRLSESPSNSMDVHQATVRTQSDSDSDMDGEADPLNWQELVTDEELKKLNTSEKKRQEVINEIFLTEASHVRMLKVLYKLFYKKLVSSQILKPDEINLIFPNIKELLDVHTEINKELRRKRKEDPLVRQIGDTLLATFTGPQGEQLQKAAASFCERQQLALELIKKRRERDNKFDSLLCECEKKRQCRRLELQSIVPYEMQRITRYPLLLERLVESVEAAEKTCSEYKDELVKLREAHLHSKAILGFVDEAAKLAHNRHRLEEIQRHLDVSNFKNSDHPIVNDFRNIDLTRYKLILEGGLQLRRPNKANVHVHVLLMEEMVVIFQKESEKFILKFFQSGSSTPMAPLSPIIKMNTLLARENAVCKNALFLVNTSTTSSQMYDLQAEDESKRETKWFGARWLKHFTDAAAAYNRREDKITRTTGSISITQPVTDSDSESILREASREPEPVVESADRLSSSFTTAEKEDANQPAETAAGEDDAVSVEDPQAGGDHTPDVTSGGGGIHVTTKVSAEEWPLIQPSQVSVAVPPVHTAESKLTPLEQIRRKDALVKQTLAEKDDLVADLLAIPREDFQHIADMASTASSNADSHSLDITDRLLATVFQVDILQRAVNDALNITEGDVIAARGGKVPICASQEGATETRSVIPSVPAGLVGEIAASLSSQLTTLLVSKPSEIKHVEEDRDRLRKELHKIREQLHEEHHLHSPVPFEDALDPDESAQ
ncbi:hypothetical protein YQE_03743, partial [Dendroctonus ponderosae]